MKPDRWLLRNRFKAILISAPKVGKTGSLGALLEGGYRVILAAFDPGYDILLNTVSQKALERLIILPFEDQRGFAGLGSKLTVDTVGDATAFAKFVAFLNDGKARQAPCQGGEVIDLGPSQTWGNDTFLVVDNLSNVATAAFERYLALAGRNRVSKTRKDWGSAADEVDSVLIQMASSFYSYHLILLSHWKVQGPREFEDEDKKNPAKTDYQNELREREKDLIPTKQVPSAIGRNLSQNLTRHFPTVVWAEIDDAGRRIFNLQPTQVRDCGVPVRPGRLPKTLPIETGLLDLFCAVTGCPPKLAGFATHSSGEN